MERAAHQNACRVDMDVVRTKKHQLEGQMKKDAHLIVQDYGMGVVQIRKPQREVPMKKGAHLIVQKQDMDVVLIIRLLPGDLMVRDVLFTVPDIDTVVVQTM